MGIEIIKKADIVRSAPECFRAQCAHWPHDTDRMAITEKLLALDLDTITAEQVDGIIGNTSWTKNKCDECDQDCEVLARFGWTAFVATATVEIRSLGAIVTEFNLNDQTVSGMRLKELPVFSVQYHPEASPGPNDANHLFRAFHDLVTKSKKDSGA